MIGEILKLFLLPVTIFRSLLTFFSMIWMIMLIAIIVLVVVYWDDVKKIFNNIVEGITNIQNTINILTVKINELQDKVDSLK